MDLQKLIDKGEIIKLPVIDKCILLTKKVVVKEKGQETPVTMEKGPCSRIADDKTCCAYFNPSEKWKLGNCGLATHLFQEEEVKKFKLNPIKASKKSRG